MKNCLGWELIWDLRGWVVGSRKRLNIPTTQQIEDSQNLSVGSSVGSFPSTRSTRTQGVKTSALVQSKGRIPIIISPITNQQEGAYCSELISECGVIVRTAAPLRFPYWSKIPWVEKIILFKRLEQREEGYFDVEGILLNVSMKIKSRMHGWIVLKLIKDLLVTQALRRLKGTTNKKEKMSAETKRVFDHLTEDAMKLMEENGKYNVYNKNR
ncbi:CD2 antigen cytoplasmic tail-binding protein 2-like protein [Melia azedarach]|uniref:CD2 antigen cytoplasmic tail-binding protein 2-like protein n=1 Tax=Melia azedarach TaxID=155640 RepID=A0ACC1Y6Y7_MELAZ|nr:CD2 antigen cytoplasmic tail-binding protein 2-like protein [Melia azedarach]